ncbi:MAG: hypothetical protein Q8N58_02875, partial [bacterium]|nr:hypothetical protein [bacterium]
IEQPKIVKPKPKIKIKLKRKPRSKPQPQFQPAEESFSDVKERRNALQLRKVIEEEEKQLVEQEKAWETPAIFRRKKE